MMLQSVGWIAWSENRGPWEPQKGKPFRLYANKSTAQKVTSDWTNGTGYADIFGAITVKEVFVGATSMNDAINEAIQARVYERIDSKPSGLADCNVTEIIEAIAAGVADCEVAA